MTTEHTPIMAGDAHDDRTRADRTRKTTMTAEHAPTVSRGRP
ncbi:hypothetical protein [Streptosporangium sp. NPDC048865]